MPLNPDRLSFGTSFKGQSKSRRKKENIVSFGMLSLINLFHKTMHLVMILDNFICREISNPQSYELCY